jgi:hypothetical protein
VGRDQVRHSLEVRNIRNSVSHDYSAGLGRLRFDEIERESLVHAAEERLAVAQDGRVNNEPEFIDQVLVWSAAIIVLELLDAI